MAATRCKRGSQSVTIKGKKGCRKACSSRKVRSKVTGRCLVKCKIGKQTRRKTAPRRCVNRKRKSTGKSKRRSGKSKK